VKDRITALLQDGQVAARAGQKAKARAKFRAVLLRDPENVTALLWLAWLDDDPNSSLAHVYRALAHDPENADAYAALRWARRCADASSPQEPPSLPESVLQAPRRRWRRVAAVGAACLLAVLVGGAPNWTRPEATPATVALAPTAAPTATATATSSPTPIPTWTPIATSPPATPTPPRVPTSTRMPGDSVDPTLPPLSPSAFHEGVRWIDVDLAHQILTAYEGQELVRTTLVSTGTGDNPTPTGLYRIQIKMRYDDMSGPDYYLRNVPYVMYFYRGYGLHGTYWHANFGHQMSHGCINLPTLHAEWLYNWAEVGTLVYIHE
jgi:lipoprotein-anchoring transpeptidase ErfK/SrfK